MKICFLPIDNRPVCYNLAKDIVAIDESINLIIPDRSLLGDLNKTADVHGLLKWLKDCPECDAIILSLDTLIYGGLIPSRRSNETLDDLKLRLSKVKDILKTKQAKVYAFSSIMRISNNNYNEEEKEYWSEYGKKIFEYSYNLDKDGTVQTDVPDEILEDYLNTRTRNFEVNKIYLDWQKEGLFDTLIFSKDDCAEYGLNVREAKELERLGGFTKTGADEIPLTLLARAVNKEIKVFVYFTEPDYKDCISNYEDVSIEKSTLGQLELGGFKVVDRQENSDIVLIVNNFIQKQGELVMDWETVGGFNEKMDIPTKPFAIADVRYANGGDNKFVEFILKNLNLADDKNFFGYAGWNTSANTLGSLLATVKIKYGAKNYNELSFKKLQMIRFLDDWAYQANVRAQISAPTDISNLMESFENVLSAALDYRIETNIKYLYPWDRKFEIEVNLS